MDIREQINSTLLLIDSCRESLIKEPKNLKILEETAILIFNLMRYCHDATFKPQITLVFLDSDKDTWRDYNRVLYFALNGNTIHIRALENKLFPIILEARTIVTDGTYDLLMSSTIYVTISYTEYINTRIN